MYESVLQGAFALSRAQKEDLVAALKPCGHPAAHQAQRAGAPSRIRKRGDIPAPHEGAVY